MTTPDLSTIVVTLDTARALHAAGWERPTALAWQPDRADDGTPAGWLVTLAPDTRLFPAAAALPAPTLAELLDALPDEVEHEGWTYDLFVYKSGNSTVGFGAGYEPRHNGTASLHQRPCEFVHKHTSAAEAAARLWLALHAAGLLPEPVRVAAVGRARAHYRYTVRYEDGVYVATVPALPGLVTHADDRADLPAAVADAVEAWIATAREMGRDVPPPDGTGIGPALRGPGDAGADPFARGGTDGRPSGEAHPVR